MYEETILTNSTASNLTAINGTSNNECDFIDKHDWLETKLASKRDENRIFH